MSDKIDETKMFPRKKDIEEIEMIGNGFKLGHMTPDDIKASLIEEPFILPPELIRCRLRDSGPIILRIIEDAIYRL